MTFGKTISKDHLKMTNGNQPKRFNASARHASEDAIVATGKHIGLGSQRFTTKQAEDYSNGVKNGHLTNAARGAKPRLRKPLSVLLATASSGGTIAAVRQLGGNGIDVGVLAGPGLAAAAWSSFARRSYPVPAESESQRFLDRLLAIGSANPGQILLPTSDETTWLYTLNAAQLAKHFCLYLPSIDSIRQILDKRSFEDAATRAGLTVLPSWEPQTLEEVDALAPSAAACPLPLELVMPLIVAYIAPTVPARMTMLLIVSPRAAMMALA